MTETEITTATLNCTSSGQHDDAVTHSLLDMLIADILITVNTQNQSSNFKGCISDLNYILRVPIENSKVLACQANCWRVYKWHCHLDIFHDNSVEQPLVTCQQVHEVNVLVQVSRTSLNIQHCYVDLIFLTGNCWWQETVDLQQLLLTHRITPTLTPTITMKQNKFNHTINKAQLMFYL